VMLTRLSEVKDRQNIFGLNFMLLNLGIGLGGLFASLVITEGSLRSFQIMYILDSFTFLLFLFVVLLIRTPLVGKYIPEAHEPKSGSYRDVWENKKIVLLSISGLILLVFGYASLQAGLPIYATQYLGLSPKWIGIFMPLIQSRLFYFNQRCCADSAVNQNTKHSLLLELSGQYRGAWLEYHHCCQLLLVESCYALAKWSLHLAK